MVGGRRTRWELGWVVEEIHGAREKTVQVFGVAGPDGAARCVESATILMACFLALASCRPLTGTCSWPPGCSHNAYQSVFGVGRGNGVPHSDGGGEDILDGGSLELGANFRGDVHLPQQF